jgi:NAD(P)H-dependent FMN reductase
VIRLLLVTGSTRSGSTNTAALRTAHELLGERATFYDALAELPPFNPDDDHDPLPDAVVELRAQIARAHAVVFCTPEYAGTLPGSFKNLLDWTVGGAEMYGKPATWINVAAPGRGTGADATLATVLGYVGSVVLAAGATGVPVDRAAVGPAGTVDDPETRARLARAFDAILVEVQGIVDAAPV